MSNLQQATRCPECDEPEFMCCCSKEFQGKVVSEVYHRGTFVDGKQLHRQMATLSFLPTIIIGRKAFSLKSPDRHFGDTVLMEVGK
jgi:hypothetical protein